MGYFAIGPVVSGAVGPTTVTGVIENGVTVVAGDTIAASLLTLGRVDKADAAVGGAQNGRFIGIAQSGGTGDAGGTISVLVQVNGLQTAPLASFAAGDRVFVPVGGGPPVSPAPLGAGILAFRIGFAIDGTNYVINPGESTLL